MTPAEAARHVLRALDGGDAVAEVVVIQGPHAGRRMLVWATRTLGGLGDLELDRAAADLARSALEAGGACTERVQLGGRAHTLFVEAHRPPGELVIVGAGHIARPLCSLGAMLGFRVTVVDDRPEFAVVDRFPEADRVLRVDFRDPFADVAVRASSHVVLVTRGHKYDYEALLRLMRAEVEPAYVGMVGSRRRVRAALQQLVRAGVEVDRLRRVHTPIGLDIGAETPEEIAVSIAAELVVVRRGGTGRPLRDVAGVVERWIERSTEEP